MIEIALTREISLVPTVAGAGIEVSVEVMPEIAAQATQGGALSTISVMIERDE